VCKYFWVPTRFVPLGRPRHKWEDVIKMYLQEGECGGMDWIGLVADRDSSRAVVNAVMDFRVPLNAGNFLARSKPVSFCKKDCAVWSE
jgi:hypothetical protein